MLFQAPKDEQIGLVQVVACSWVRVTILNLIIEMLFSFLRWVSMNLEVALFKFLGIDNHRWTGIKSLNKNLLSTNICVI